MIGLRPGPNGTELGMDAIAREAKSGRFAGISIAVAFVCEIAIEGLDCKEAGMRVFRR